ncbi:3-deoxy-manno-octulosonate cytidylyltransferase [Bacteroidota bacterium]
MNLQFIGIIPARYESKRFPGKPLAKIGNKSMIQRVYEKVSSILDDVIVATDDSKIYKEVKYFEGKVLMTSPEHKTGTERCAEAFKLYTNETGKTYDGIINIQADEPFVTPKQIKTLMNCFLDKTVQIATLIKKIKNKEDIFDPNVVKAVVSKMGAALYFSRSPIPYNRDHDKENWIENTKYYKHVGIYAYKPEALSKITKFEPSNLEIAESLEQNRWLEEEYYIKTATTEYDSVSIDTPEDIQKAIDMGLVDDD